MRNINLQASVWSLSAISSFSSGGGVSGPQNRSASGRQHHQHPRDERGDDRSRGQCIPSSKRLPITPVAQTSKITMVTVRRLGQSSPTPAAPSWPQTWCGRRETRTRSLSASVYARISGYPAVPQAVLSPVRHDLYALKCRTHPPEYGAFFQPDDKRTRLLNAIFHP